MIYGIGVDIVKIDRIRKAADRSGRRFYEKILTENEIEYCEKKTDPYPSIAVRFAAKEALIKSVGSEVPVNMKEIEILNDERGRPVLYAGGRLEEFFREKGIKRCHLSLSHEKEFGVASVVLEG